VHMEQRVHMPTRGAAIQVLHVRICREHPPITGDQRDSPGEGFRQLDGVEICGCFTQ